MEKIESDIAARTSLLLAVIVLFSIVNLIYNVSLILKLIFSSPVQHFVFIGLLLSDCTVYLYARFQCRKLPFVNLGFTEKGKKAKRKKCNKCTCTCNNKK